MATAFGLDQLGSLYDPNIAVDQQALMRQMAIAEALRKQAQTPVDTSNRQIGGVAYKVSPMEGLAKALQAYQANQADTTNDQSRLALAQRMAQALKGMMPGGAPDAPSGAPAGAPTAGGGSPMGIGDLVQMGVANDIGGPEAAKIMGQRFNTPEAIQVLRGKGVDPKAMGAAELGEAQRKVSDATSAGRGAVNIPGAPGPVAIPTAPPGSSMAWNPQTQTWESKAVLGGLPAVKAAATAQTLGANPGFDNKGQPLPFDEIVPPDVQAKRDETRKQIIGSELGQEKNPAVRADLQTEINATRGGRAYPAPPLGTEGSQKALDTAWNAQVTKNREAQNTKSYLQNIVTAAEKGAIVGPGAERRELIQGMFQLAGIKEDVNTNATTQTQLLDKYSNQIVARLGQGGLGTDAARAILASAYPGKHMNVDAIREAAANLNGAQEMEQAKTRLLQSAAAKRDKPEYDRREIAFDQAADPRIWQYAGIRDPQQKKAFAQTLIQQDPSFAERVKALKDLGVL